MERTDQHMQQPTPATPRPSPILAEPATPAACQRDYAAAGDIRERLGWKDHA